MIWWLYIASEYLGICSVYMNLALYSIIRSLSSLMDNIQDDHFNYSALFFQEHPESNPRLRPGPHQSCVSSWKWSGFTNSKQGCCRCCCLVNTQMSSNLICFEPRCFIWSYQAWWQPLLFLGLLQLLCGEWQVSLMALLYLHIKRFTAPFILLLMPD